MVDQDLLFEGTIRENLTLWENDPGGFVTSCRDAADSRHIMSLPAHNAELRGSTCGGQRSTPRNPRALVHDPLHDPDEATSALDAETNTASTKRPSPRLPAS
jgi:ABC-type bacteriocin/lantibiotic exporter with double-glycine peptidase domain